MNKQFLKSILLTIATGLLLTNCGSKTEDPTPATDNTTLAANTWKVNDALYKLSLYGAGWASTDFSPEYGLTDYTTDTKSSKTIGITFLEKPTASGTYTIEGYDEVHLNKVRTQKITGQKLGIRISDNGGTVYHKSLMNNGGTAEITVSGNKFKAVFKKVTLTGQSPTTGTVVVSGSIAEL
jgi:hypothetical protein